MYFARYKSICFTRREWKKAFWTPIYYLFLAVVRPINTVLTAPHTRKWGWFCQNNISCLELFACSVKRFFYPSTFKWTIIKLIVIRGYFSMTALYISRSLRYDYGHHQCNYWQNVRGVGRRSTCKTYLFQSKFESGDERTTKHIFSLMNVFVDEICIFVFPQLDDKSSKSSFDKKAKTKKKYKKKN